jgi:hypothetical protein
VTNYIDLADLGYTVEIVVSLKFARKDFVEFCFVNV